MFQEAPKSLFSVHIKIVMLAIFFNMAPRNKNETGPRKEEEKGTERVCWVGGLKRGLEFYRLEFYKT
jgi:hypothetical protein